MLAVGDLPHDCRKCVRPEMRKQWGCDVPTPRPQANYECQRCAGRGCEACIEGKVPVYKCPRAALKDDDQAAHLVNFFFSSFHPHGLLPASGGVLDQPSGFHQAMVFLSGLYARWQRDMDDAERRKAERSAKKAKK